jgi:uncharacterized protein with HEPN domain
MPLFGNENLSLQVLSAISQTIIFFHEMEFRIMDGEAVKAIEMESLLIGETRAKIYRRGK